MRILAVDFGRKRLGLALSDPTATVAGPLPAIQRKGEVWWSELLELIRVQGVAEIVVGLPRNMDGSYGPSADICRKFAADLEQRCGLKPYLLDERLTSKAASKTLREGGLSERQQRGKLDSVAASLLLQVYLGRRGVLGGDAVPPESSRRGVIGGDAVPPESSGRGTSPPGEKPAP